jgi:hypothetical protein
MKTHALVLLAMLVLAMICSMAVAAMREGVRIEANGKVIDIERGHLVPCVSDWNNDGRKDLLVGHMRTIILYKNVGTQSDLWLQAPVLIEPPEGSFPCTPSPCVVDWGGGGLDGCGGTIQNNLISGNSSNDGGGLMYCPGSIQNNTITGNSALDSLRSRGGGLYGCEGTIQNCIIWGNNAREGSQLIASAVPSDSCIQDWSGGGVNNMALDPQFVDTDGSDDNPSTYYDNDYRLKATSPCVDARENEPWMFGTLDLDGNNRIFKGANSATVDMGAYKYGSFPFGITNVKTTPALQVQLTWTSRPGDNYTVWSRTSLPGWAWVNEAIVPSQGYSTTWASSSTAVPVKFYRIELR